MDGLMNLWVWPSDFLLPSVDATSLQFMACARMCAAAVTVVKQGLSTAQYFKQDLPLFRHGQLTYSNVESFVTYLRKQIADLPLDGHLSKSQHASSHAYKALIEEKLLPAYLYTVWMDTPNTNVISSRWYAMHLPLGLGLHFAQSRKNQAEKYLRSIYAGKLVTTEDIEYITTKRCSEALRALSAKLGDQKFFFGDKPSSLDALAFGYLAVLLKVPFPNDKIQREIRNYPNLTRLVDSIINVYLPLTDEEVTNQRARMPFWEEARNKAQAELFEPQAPPKDYPSGEDEEEFPLRDKVFFTVSAGVLALLFCLHFGIISVQVERVYDKAGVELD